MANTNLFNCYVQEYRRVGGVENSQSNVQDFYPNSHNASGRSFPRALIKFLAATDAPSGEDVHFIIRIKGQFTEYPSPLNIDQIKCEASKVLAAAGLKDISEAEVCWNVNANNHWHIDNVCHSDHEHLPTYMSEKPHQIKSGEAFLAFKIPTNQRYRLPAVEAAIDTVIAERLKAREY